MRFKPVLYTLAFLVLSIIISFIVSASNAPPPIPTEYWGRLMIDGEPAPPGTTVSYYDAINNITINTTTDSNGYYNLILTGGDSDLTFNDDPNCTAHNANGTACIPCTVDFDCVEGPTAGQSVNITVNNTPVQITWGDDASSDENMIASIHLYQGWNMVSLPFKALNESIQSTMNLLSGTKLVDYYDTPSATWKRYNSGTPPFTWTLSSVNVGKGYWVRVDSEQTWTISGTPVSNNQINLTTGWNLVSFQLYNDTVQNAMAQLSGTKLVDYYDTPTTTWKRYNSGTPPFTWTLSSVNVGKGYWVRVDSNQIWVEP